MAVEAAFVLPLALIFLFGTWEVGRIIELNQILYNAAREGASIGGRRIECGHPGHGRQWCSKR